MSALLITNAKIVTDRITNGCVLTENGKIRACLAKTPEGYSGDVFDARGMYLSPGFIDVHTHGAGGADFMVGSAEAVITAAKAHLAHGATGIVPTSVAAPYDRIVRFIDNFKEAKGIIRGGPALLGMHLEGPYLNPEYKGAIDERYITPPVEAEYKELTEMSEGMLIRWTIAPELPGAMEMADYLVLKGIKPSVGHSSAVYAQVREAFERGFRHVTHLYSSMSTITRRGGFRLPGVIESAYIIEGMTAELISDGCHLPPEMLLMAYRMKGAGRLCMVTDSMRVAGRDEASSVIGDLVGGLPVIIEDGVAKLPDRSAFAGSVATCDRLVRVMRDSGVPLCDCVRMMCEVPAEMAGAKTKGRIAEGMDADLVIFDEGINIKKVFIGGREAAYGQPGF